MKNIYKPWIAILPLLILSCSKPDATLKIDFTKSWKFRLFDDAAASEYAYNDSAWRTLNLPHDWSIEGTFSKEHPSTINEGALPTGIAWYRKTFRLPRSARGKMCYIEFDGIYRNSEVWINGHYLGKRPNGYISFRYDLTPYILKGKRKNVVAVRVDNSAQPDSRWYSGSGIYRNVRLVITGKIHPSQWGVFITTPDITNNRATVVIETQLENHSGTQKKIEIEQAVFDSQGRIIASNITRKNLIDTFLTVNQCLYIDRPVLWSIDNPYLYTCKTFIYIDGQLSADEENTFGVRYFRFDADKGFYLNDKPLKILGVCLHHDLGALGAAVNTRAIERRLELLKEMGCNAIRTAHNPPAPELLILCDRLGFLVMDEAFDVWKKKKVKHDFHEIWDEWHRKDLEDLIKRDRNHPSVIIWSIGNEIREQFDSSGISMTKELVGIVKSLDKTRPVTCALTENQPEKNFIYRSGALDLISFNYKHQDYINLPVLFPGQKILASENISAYASRGCYNMPSDSIQHWPEAYNVPLKSPNPDFTVSSYDHISAYWGSTHNETWRVVKDLEFISGMFIWSGFDYLGEPSPYQWPARSSYFGIIDLAGFPKDTYFMYQSEWTDKPVLHLFPHWNWKEGQLIDVWAYFNNADEVELFINGRSAGIKRKTAEIFHVMWRVKYQPGSIKAISRKNGKPFLEREIKTADKPCYVVLSADRNKINADGKDLSFVTVRITDKEGNLVPYASNLVYFNVSGPGFIAGVDNGYQASMEPFKANYRKAYNGMCAVIIQSNGKKGKINLKASSEGLKNDKITILAN
jgi:beta-galactosidase